MQPMSPMSCTPGVFTPAVLALAGLLLVGRAHAADLDRLYQPLPVAPAPLGVLDDPAIVVEAPVVVVRRLPPPPPVGGAFLYAPGLNGPLGPPAYPLLPFAFGYGY